MSRRKKKGINPVFAGCLLVAGLGVAGNSFLGPTGPGASTNADVEIVEDPGMELQSATEGDMPEIRWSDLLAKHGSFDGKSDVRVAFSVLDEVRTAMPSGETAGGATLWEGPDPPELRLGVVMISDKSKRAVLGGRVVGVSEEVAGIVIQSIDRDRVVTQWGNRVLTYDLEDGWPREFRAEARRRKLQSKGEFGNGGSEGGAVVNPGEEGK